MRQSLKCPSGLKLASTPDLPVLTSTAQISGMGPSSLALGYQINVKRKVTETTKFIFEIQLKIQQTRNF